MDIYVVFMATTQGPGGPVVSTLFFKGHQDALVEFTECTKSLTDDPSTILLIKVDAESGENTILDYFKGTDEDWMDQWGRDYESDQDDEPTP